MKEEQETNLSQKLEEFGFVVFTYFTYIVSACKSLMKQSTHTLHHIIKM